MKFASAISERPAMADAVAEAADGLTITSPDLVVAFVSPHHAAAWPALPDLVGSRFPRATVFGCSGAGVIGAGREIEGRCALSLTAASLPGVHLMPMRFRPVVDDVEVPRNPAAFVILADPWSIDAEILLGALDAACPAVPKIGGVASGGTSPGSIALFLGSEVCRDGAVGMALSGDLGVDTVVAQGCRAVGRPMVVNRCQGNVILELDRKKPLQVLSELYASLEADDRELFHHSLHVGIEMDRARMTVEPGEFLMRNFIGVDPEEGSVIVGAPIEAWQVVQFFLRDAHAAEEELRSLLGRPRATPAGALLFSCLGRGQHFFGRADHDTDLFRRSVGPVPLGGFFCNGEIGPVGGRTFLHGYTSSFGLFRSAQVE